MVVAEKRRGENSGNIFDTVLSIMGVTNLKSVSVHSTFPELGMDSMTAIEIKQTLERKYQFFLTAQDIRSMTLSKLKDLTSTQKTEAQAAPITLVDAALYVDIKLMLRNIGDAESASIPLVKLKTLVGDNDPAPHIFILPGIEGNSATVEAVCSKLKAHKAHVSCLQYVANKRRDSVEELAEAILPYIESVEYKINLERDCFRSELLYLLETKGKTAKVIFVDGSPEMVCNVANTYFPAGDEAQFQIIVLTVFMMSYMSYDEISKQKEALINCNTYVEKIEHLMSIAPRLDQPKDHIINGCIAVYDRLKAANKYKIRPAILKSDVTLIKAKSAFIAGLAADYGLSSILQNKPEVVTVNGNHSTIIDNADLANEINRVLNV
ncbi:Phosphopantetheine attachment site [Popillia japonica]|uniref:Phosphopantetheine attachment site n=1 Tax=Popillia japonica TaxID=7064 RepID=A0AAW1MJN1_POPJA